MRSMPLIWCQALVSLAVLLAGLAPTPAPGAPGASGRRHSFDVDFASIPRIVREPSPAPDALRRVSIRPYGPGESLAAWRATRRRVLAVRLEVPGPWAFLSPPVDDMPRSSAPETCVPPDYRWQSVPVGWSNLTRQGDDLFIEEVEARFDPRRCALSDAQRSNATARPLLTLQQAPLVFAFRDAEVLSVLLPRGARLVTDATRPRVYIGEFVRVDLSIKPGAVGSVHARFATGLTGPEAPSEVEVSVESLHLDGEADPRIVVFAKAAPAQRIQ
jgi:hypothetical protein